MPDIDWSTAGNNVLSGALVGLAASVSRTPTASPAPAPGTAPAGQPQNGGAAPPTDKTPYIIAGVAAIAIVLVVVIARK